LPAKNLTRSALCQPRPLTTSKICNLSPFYLSYLLLTISAPLSSYRSESTLYIYTSFSTSSYYDIFNASLSRRFSLLRSVGDPLLLGQLRSRLADQRARGAENQITEEEEEMFLETLERMRPKNMASRSNDSVDQGARNSLKSTAPTSVSSSPSSRSTKRYSNNLFGSGRLRDYTYLKSVTSSRGSASSSSRTVSLTPTEASEKTFRPSTPESGSNPTSSVQSSPNENGGPVHPAPQVPFAPYGEQQLQVITAAEYRLQKTLGPSVLKRASMALDEAIREIEDEVEDEILLPRSVPVPRGSLEQLAADVVGLYLYFLIVHVLNQTKNLDFLGLEAQQGIKRLLCIRGWDGHIH